MRIETQHKGYAISFSENSEEWTCYQIEYSSKSLAAVRRKIDVMDRERRKAASVPCFVLNWHGAKDGVVVELASADRFERKAFVMVDDGDRKPSRRKLGISELAPDTPEVRALIAEWQTADRKAKEAAKRAETLLKAIPRLTAEGLAELAEVPE